MKYSFNWLKEYVAIRLPLDRLAERLTLTGLEVVSLEKRGDDTILEVEVTPNRPDLLSHIGVAREIAALTGSRLKLPRIAKQTLQKKRQQLLPLPISILDKRGCPRYIGRLFESVQVRPSPAWLKERLERLGLRSVNNIVDLTNFVLLEWGQPLHAFDYVCLAGGKLLIRAAKQSERLTTIDGENRQLKEGQLVIADAERPVAVAGVIGGRNSEISEKTRRVLLESAFFDPVRIRQSSRQLGLVTESSYRFERSVSWEGVSEASDRAAALFQDIAQACPIGRVVDIGRKPPSPKAISLSVPHLHETLGVLIGSRKSASFLTSLGCKVSGKGDSIRVTPPPFRRDLKLEEDLIEEIARVFGYDSIPPSLPPIARRPLGQAPQAEEAFRQRMAQVKSLLTSQGLFEVITYSLLSRTLQKYFSKTPAIAIQNPLSLEQELMRTSLLPRLAEVAAHNFNHKAEGVAIFELGPVYEMEATGSYRERQGLGILFAGKTPSHWKVKSRPYDYFDVKGKCELVCETLGIRAGHQEKSLPFLIGEGAAALFLDSREEVGAYGELGKSIRQVLGIEVPVFVAELDMTRLLQIATSFKHYRPAARYPSVTRDISLIIREGILSQTFEETIRRVAGELLHDVFLFDDYVDPSHKVVPRGSRSLAYRMEFLHPEKTLTQQEVDQAVQSIQKALTELGAQIRA